MSKTKYRNLLILGIVIVLLVAGIIAYRTISAKVAEQKEAEAEAESLANMIYATNLEDVVSVSFEGLTFTYDADTDTWSYADDPDFPLEAYTIPSIVAEFKCLIADRALTDGDTLENYGLADPAYTVTLADSTGEETIVKVGNTSNSAYYVCVNDDASTIYRCVLGTLSSISGNLLDYANIDDVGSVWYSTVTGVTIESASESYSLNKETVEVTETETDAESGEEVTSLSTDDVWFLSINGAEAYEVTDEDSLSSWLSALDFSYSSCIAYNTEGKDLSEYYLKEPTYVITVTYTDENDSEETLTIKLGGAYTDGYMTAMSSLSDEIYLITAEDFAAIEAIFDENLISEDSQE